jgi:acyl carrier protein
VSRSKWREQDLREHVRGVVALIAPIKDGPVKPTSRFGNDLGYDSLGLVELVIVLEQELELSDVDERASGVIESVLDLEDLIVAAVFQPEGSAAL